jgi:hypothetical protein
MLVCPADFSAHYCRCHLFTESPFEKTVWNWKKTEEMGFLSDEIIPFPHPGMITSLAFSGKQAGKPILIPS